MAISIAQHSLVEELVKTLQVLPDVHPESQPLWETATAAGQADAEIHATIAGKPVRILIELKKSLFPRDVHQVIGQQKASDLSFKQLGESDAPIWMLVSQTISPGAREILKQERVGYYDSGGSLFLPAPGAYLYIEKPAAKAMQKVIRSLFSGRRAQVSHALLLNHRRWFVGQELAQLAQVSPATASQVLRELERQDWVVSEGEGPNKKRRLQEPGMLLDQWIQQLSSMRPPDFLRFFVPSLKAEHLQDSIGRIFETHAVSYAISFEAAAQRYAPYLSSISQVRCRLSPGPASDAALTELDARPVTEGANFAVIEASSTGELLFRQQLEGIWCASPIQVYIDLSHSGGRAREMAQHLRRERIGF
jgi:hypothetical protein